MHHLHYKRRKNTGLARVPGIHVGELLLKGRELKLVLDLPIWHPDDKQSSRTIGSYYADDIGTEPLREDEAMEAAEPAAARQRPGASVVAAAEVSRPRSQRRRLLS